MSAAAPLTKRCPSCGGEFEDAVFCPRDGTRLGSKGADSGDPYLGLVLGGDIELAQLAGQGGMGRVYRARQRSIDRDVAVKVLHKELCGNPQLVRRFHREAKIASKMRHPHVVDMHMIGQLDDGSLYIVMEYLDGSSLAGLLEREQRLPLGRALSIVLQVAGAVGEGHEVGIVHRDLKPENVMLVRRGTLEDWVKVLDFGIARIEIGDQSMETTAGGVLGTARYISPEGATGAPVGPPGDVYALATMLYQMLAGRTPFDAPLPVGLLVKHAHEPPPSLRELAAEVPEPIAKVIMDNLAKDPAARAQSGRAFATLLTAAASSSVGDAPYTVRSFVTHEVDVGTASTMLGAHVAAESSGPNTTPLTSSGRAPVRLLPTDDTPSSALTPPPIDTARTASSHPRARALWMSLAAFVVGVAVSAIVVVKTSTPDAARTEAIAKIRRTIADGHYVRPAGANVRELTDRALERWPDDTSFIKLRSDAQHEMTTLALTAENAGDLIGAAELASAAVELDPNDRSTRLLAAQTKDAVSAARSGQHAQTGQPRMLFEAPALARSGYPVVLKVRFIRGSAGAEAVIDSVHASVTPSRSLGQGELALHIVRDGDEELRVEFVAPKEGHWDIAFGASIGGSSVRAVREFDVTQ